MTKLQDEIAAYDKMRPELEATDLGKWALVHDRKLVATFADFEKAAAEAVRRFGRGPYLIRQIGATTSGVLPASVMYRPLNGPNTVRLP